MVERTLPSKELDDDHCPHSALDPSDCPECHVRRLTRDKERQRAELREWVKANGPGGWIDDLRKRCSSETGVDWKARAETAEGILGHNMALANATTRRTMTERDGIVRKLREKYSAIEIADMVGLTRQRVHQILNEAHELKASEHCPTGDYPHSFATETTERMTKGRCIYCGQRPAMSEGEPR